MKHHTTHSQLTARLAFCGLLILALFSAMACTMPTKQQVIDKLTGCPPYQEEVAFPSSRDYAQTANVTPIEEEEEVEPDYLDKMYKKVHDDFVDSGVDLEEITNGFKAKGIIIERQKGTDGYTKLLRVSLDGDVAFASGSAKLTPKARELIGKLGDAMAEYPSTKAIIEGHTDSDGSAVSNQRLSQRRAVAVKTELVTVKHIASRRIIKAVGYGESRLLVNPEKTPQDKARNRRVEILLSPVTKTITG